MGKYPEGISLTLIAELKALERQVHSLVNGMVDTPDWNKPTLEDFMISSHMAADLCMKMEHCCDDLSQNASRNIKEIEEKRRSDDQALFDEVEVVPVKNKVPFDIKINGISVSE